MKTVDASLLREAVKDLTITVPASTFLAMSVMLDGFVVSYPGHGFKGVPESIMDLVIALNPDPKTAADDMSKATDDGQAIIFAALDKFVEGLPSE